MQDSADLLSDKLFSQNSSYSEDAAAEIECTVDEYTRSVFDAEDFRIIYSVIPQSFINLVGNTEFNEWASTVYADEGMAIVQFVEHFEISKEEFDGANRKFAKYIYDIYGTSPLYKASYKQNEIYEIYNTDLIYSSDREAVEAYYKAVSEDEYPKESGAGSHSMPAEIIVPEDYYK